MTVRKILELAYEGQHGADRTTLTREQIEQIASTYHEDDAPIIIGHADADNKMAYGRVKRVWTEERDGKLWLLGEVELLEDIAAYYDLGAYNRWSIGITRNADGEYYLHHLALLGATPPKIKGLKELSAYSDDLEIFEFADKPIWVSFAKTNWPICLDCPDGYNWDADAARKKIVNKFGWQTLKKCVGAVDTSEDNTPEAFYKYAFPFCDVINGKIMIIPKAVATGLAYLNGARGVKVSPDLAKIVRPILEKLDEKIKNEKEKEKNMDDKHLEDKKMEELEKLKRELEEKERALKEFAEKERALKAKLQAEKRKDLEKAIEGKLPKEKAEKLLKFADSVGVETVVEFSDDEKLDIYEILIDVFNDVIAPDLDKEKIQDGEGQKAYKDLAQKF